MAANLIALFKFFIFLLMMINVFFLIRQLIKRNLRRVIINSISLLILIILFFIPNYIENLPIKSRPSNQLSKKVKTKLIIGIEGAYYPWNYILANGEPAGFDVSIAKEVASRLNMTTKFIVTPFESLITNLSNKQYDLVVSSISITPERRQNVDFTIPYADVPVSFFGKKSIYGKLVNADLNTLKQVLKNKTVGTQIGTTWPKFLEKTFKNTLIIKYYNTQPQLMMEVNSGRLDVGFSELPSVISLIKDHPNIVMFGPKLGIQNSALLGEGIGIAVSKGNDQLLKQVNEVLRAMHKDGTISKLYLQYFGLELTMSKY